MNYFFSYFTSIISIYRTDDTDFASFHFRDIGSWHKWRHTKWPFVRFLPFPFRVKTSPSDRASDTLEVESVVVTLGTCFPHIPAYIMHSQWGFVCTWRHVPHPRQRLRMDVMSPTLSILSCLRHLGRSATGSVGPRQWRHHLGVRVGQSCLMWGGGGKCTWFHVFSPFHFFLGGRAFSWGN